MTTRFDEQVVVITGAGTGIGRVTALAYARAGARVVIAGRRPAPLEETAHAIAAAGGDCLVHATDVTREADCIALIDRTLHERGRLDVLVNNAGLPGTDMLVAAMTLENWNQTIATNLTGPMLLTREALRRAMLPARRGNVQFCSSMAARNVRAGKAHYAVAKLGLVALTETLAREVSDHGVRVNCLMIGLVAGELVDGWAARLAKESGKSEADIRAALVADIPLKRPLGPDEIAAVSLFLASDAASSLTGQTLRVSGGR